MKIRFSKGAMGAQMLAELFGGRLQGGEFQEKTAEWLCTDSREADESTVFCALRGERTDGHKYIQNVLEAGCPCILCEEEQPLAETYGTAVILVENTEEALSVFAKNYRKNLNCQAVAVTGSVGKTTTKEMIAAVLSQRHETYRTEGNHNSVIGMPMSVGEIPEGTQWAVLEMGMSGFGEIERMSRAAEPDVAVITNVGTAHMEMLGSRENICRAKLEILCGLRKGGTLILNGDEPLLKQVRGKSYKTVYVSVLGESCDLSAKNIRVEEDRTLFDLSVNGETHRDLRINVMGKHNVYAALYAIAVGLESGMELSEIREGLLRFQPKGLRQRMTTCGDWIFLEDCYNASPESMLAALEVLREYCNRTGRRSVAVLGDMLELGVRSCSMHQEVGKRLAEMGIDMLITLGDYGKQIAVGAGRKGMKQILCLEIPADEKRCAETAARIKELLLDGDVILFKASRGVGEERVIEALRNLTEIRG